MSDRDSINGYRINPQYAHRTSPIGYKVTRPGFVDTWSFERKRDAVEWCRKHADGPPNRVTLDWVDGKRVWGERPAK